MKRILIWTAMPMQECLSMGKVLAENLFGTNTGNVLFLASVARALMTGDDVVIEPAFALEDADDETLERINAEFDCFVIPLANAFRQSYADKLRRLTALVRRLKMPCVVIGVGLQATLEQSVKSGFDFDGVVVDFVRAVLEKSAMLGVRGEYTAEYLKHLGFAEERDFTMIGCPSMFMWGKDLPEIRRTDLNAESKVCINGKIDANAQIHAFMRRSCGILTDYYYVPQRIEELWMMYCGVPLMTVGSKSERCYMPMSRSNRMIRKKRSVAFANAYAWVDFMAGMDFSYGCNIHGNIAAMLAGTPCMVIERDKRVSELARFIGMPMITADDLCSSSGIVDLFERADFGLIRRRYAECFGRFVNFLDVSGLEHIYGNSIRNGEAPYDRLMRRLAPEAVYPRGAYEILKDPWTRFVYREAGKVLKEKMCRRLHIQ